MGWWCIISMEILCSFLRRHSAGKPVVELQNVGCFLMLVQSISNPSPAHSNIIYINEPYWPTKLREKINRAFSTKILLKRFLPQALHMILSKVQYKTITFVPELCLPFVEISSICWKMVAKAWNWYQRWLWRNGTRTSAWNIPSGKTGLPFQMFFCSQKFSTGTTQPKKLCSIYFPTGFSRNFLYVVYNHCYINKYPHSSGSELPAVETHLILFSHPLFLFLCTIRSNITDNSDFPSMISTCALPSLKASVIILTCSLEYLVHVDLSASLSHVRELRLGELKLEAAARTVPFVSTLTFFAWVASVVSLLSELAKKEK